MIANNKRDPMPDEFTSREEVAEFWDTHDITDYLDELKPVKLEFASQLSHDVIVRFDSDEFRKICKTASSYGISPITLIHSWVLERLEE